MLIGSRAVDGASNLFQYDAATGVLGQQLTTGSPGTQFAVLSPDRGSMIYVQTSGTGNTLRTAAVDGSEDRLLFGSLPADCTSVNRPAWNPIAQTELALPCVLADGTVVVHRVSVTGEDLGTIVTGFPVVDDLAYSPDGRMLVYWAAQTPGVEGKLYTQPVDGGSPTLLVDPGAGATDADATWSPDGDRIVFRRVSQDAAGSTVAQIMVVNADGSDLVPITDGTTVDQDPIWSPDGTHIAFKSNRTNAAGTRDNQIWVINADGTGLTELGASAVPASAMARRPGVTGSPRAGLRAVRGWWRSPARRPRTSSAART